MKRFLIAALLAGVAAAIPGPLSAQQHPGGGPGGGGHPGGGHPSGGGHPAPAMHAPHMGASAARFHATMHRPVSHGYAHHPISHAHHPVAHVNIHHHHVTVHTGHVTHHGVHHVSAAVHARGHVSARVAGLRKNIHAAHRFHAGIYRAPPGYHYRRWGYGEFLPAAYWSHDYWLSDFLAYGLFGPPDGYVWVRYGPDAMLVDEYTGEIIQVEYDAFY